jgi:hypothetical protein
VKHITITGQFVEAYPERTRGDLMRMIFSLAASEHFDIRVARQHWE